MTIIFKKSVYPLEAILSACCIFLDRAYIHLDDKEKEGNLLVHLTPKKKLSIKGLKILEGELMNELLHCVLRYKINKNNKKIREHIISCALYSALPISEKEDLLIADTQNLEYQQDPLGIAVPWEEKVGK